MAPEHDKRADATGRGVARALTGRLMEYEQLLDLLTERPGLVVVSSDPWSGTSALLPHVLDGLDGAHVLVDARSCSDARDLAMTIADAAVSTLAPTAAAWWRSSGPPSDRDGMRLMRALSTRGIDLENLRTGAGQGLDRVAEAFELTLALTDGRATVVIDHAGLLLEALSDRDARELLGVLRTVRQRSVHLDLVLVEHPDGRASSALSDAGHPMFRAGQQLRWHRPELERFREDLAITHDWTRSQVDLVMVAADLAGRVPSLTWQTVGLAPPGSAEARVRAVQGWQLLRASAESSTAREWDLLRRVHPVAQWVVAALAFSVAPHVVPANPKSVQAALRRLRGLGMAWQPERRTWVLSDPLLAAWTRDHPPAWVERRRRTMS